MQQETLNKNIFKLIEQNKFVQLKLTPIDIENKSMHMLQIVDISSSIIKQQQKNQIDQLELLNACVSHELRNPLNSIKARNMEKSYLYNNIINLI